jgi:4-hydroxybenzoate polyprenyltransferase
LIGSILGAGSLALFVSTQVLVYFVLYYTLIIFACNINCFFDLKVDGKYKRYMSEATKSFGLRNLKIVMVVEFLVILYLTYWLVSNGYYLTSVLSIIGFLCGLSYSAEPIRIKKRGFWSPFPVLIGLYTLPILGGWFLFQTSLPFYFIIFVTGYALINEGVTLVNTVEDHLEDEKEGIKTWSHLFGKKNTLRIAAVFSVLGLGTVISLFANFTGMSLISMSLLFLSTLTILVVIKQVNDVGKVRDLERSAKIHAKKMPKWFVMTRFPLLFLTLSLMF